MPSIHIRLLAAASIVLAAFLGLGGLALDRAFKESVESATREQLLGQVYALLGAAETDDLGRMRFPSILPDPRLSNPDSGLYAQISGESGNYRWNSPSMVGRSLNLTHNSEPGVDRFSRIELQNEQFYVLNFGLIWEDDAGTELSYSFVVVENSSGVSTQVSAFRGTLMTWLGGAALFLLLVQGVVLRWGLGPLRQVADDLKQIESGESESLQGIYPKELQGLTGNINSLIRNGRASRDRYRNSLGDLAHSLKTPLAVLQGAAEGDDPTALNEMVREQVPRMNDIVQYQLNRAAASGRDGVIRTIRVEPVTERLIKTLEKVYRDKNIHSIRQFDENIAFSGDEGDLMEFLGNLLENAFKYGREKVRITAKLIDRETEENEDLLLEIEDDGPGIPLQERENVLRRGERADQRVQGQGIGLSVANEIIQLYGGRLDIHDSELGGARLQIRIPYR